jgi:hypothetical protein
MKFFHVVTQEFMYPFYGLLKEAVSNSGYVKSKDLRNNECTGKDTLVA